MKRSIPHQAKFSALTALATLMLAASAAWAGEPHFIEVNVEQSGNTLSVNGKEAGLGNETQVHIVVAAEAACINPGAKHPKAANKESVTTEGDFPVQNGKALFSLELAATFQPDCTPPMSVDFSNVLVCDVDHYPDDPLCKKF